MDGSAAARVAAWSQRLASEAALEARAAGCRGNAAEDFVHRFCRIAALQERARAAAVLAGQEADDGAAPTADADESDAGGGGDKGPPTFDALSAALYAARGRPRLEAPFVAVSSKGSYRRVVDGAVLSRDECTFLAGAAAAGMVGAFECGGSTVLGLTPALEGRIGSEAHRLFRRAVSSMREHVSETCGLPALALSGAFIARLQPPGACKRRRALRAPPRAYWNAHVDKHNVPLYEHTCLLYLSDFGSDFDGGRFLFHDSEATDRFVEPAAGKVLCFSGGEENLHSVERVTAGSRFALTALFHVVESRPRLFDDDDDDGPGEDAFASWDSLLKSSAEVSLLEQDARREALLATRLSLAATLKAVAHSDLRYDWCDARVDYGDSEAPAPAPAQTSHVGGDHAGLVDTGLVDAGLVSLVDAALAVKRRGGSRPEALDLFGGDDSDDDSDDDG
ncbi:hypothetical protein M885DRAFT_611378 [Pelagophyceae sp. CCMP2097]|nr:hypothetical protein M885DRAFT_611378 [Pelagophyceae sp. CCMP2097]